MARGRPGAATDRSRLAGRGAVVTGGGRGIGAAIARQLAARGAAVIVCSRTPPQVERVAAQLRAAGADAYALVCDVADPDSVAAMARAAQGRLAARARTVDILVNNAGIADSAPFSRVSLDQWETLHRVNATGPLLVTQAFLGGMLERGWGRIVNVSSVASLHGAPYITAYAASKHALLGMARCLAAELDGTGVTVNSVCPGYVDTPMTDQSLAKIAAATGRPAEELRAGLKAAQPAGRLITPDEVAGAVTRIAEDETGSIQGAEIAVEAPAHGGPA